MRFLVVVGEPRVRCLHVARVLQQLFEAALELVWETAAEGELAPEIDASFLGVAPLALTRDIRLNGFPL